MLARRTAPIFSPLVKSAQLEAERNHPAEAEHLFADILALEPEWVEARNAFALFLIQRGEVIEPAEGNAKLRDAVQICQGTLALNQRGEIASGLGPDPERSGRRAPGSGNGQWEEEGRKFLEQTVAAHRSALEVFTKISSALPGA